MTPPDIAQAAAASDHTAGLKEGHDAGAHATQSTPSAPTGHAGSLVLYGASGDLARKKLLPALYQLTRRGLLDMPVIGVAASDMTDEQLREHARASVHAFFANAERAGRLPDGECLDEAVLEALCARLSMVCGDYRDPATFEAVRERLGAHARPLHYLAIPPSLFATVVEQLARTGLNEGARVVVEKPFGRDSDSAEELNTALHAAFSEEAIFRIDHFLGKDSVESLLVLRFANSIFEPVWDRRYIESVQITMAESFGVEGRGTFYESVGAVRDVIQNHLAEVVALLAMEPPVSSDAAALAAEKAKVLHAIRPIDPANVVRGQYRTYRDEDGVAPASTVETYAALRLDIDSWRWSGVPFFVRAGKKLTHGVTEAVVTFRQAPTDLFGAGPAQRNRLRFRLGPTGSISLEVLRKDGEHHSATPVTLTVSEGTGHRLPQDAYARLIGDALRGRSERFASLESVRAAWVAVSPLLEMDTVELYEEGTWGPASADRITAEHGGWIEPHR